MAIEISEIFFLIVISFLFVYIFLQVLIAARLNLLTKYLFDIAAELKTLTLVNKIARRNPIQKSCSTCKNRMPFFDFQRQYDDILFYRCKISKAKVEPDYFCEYFEPDKQQKDVD